MMLKLQLKNRGRLLIQLDKSGLCGRRSREEAGKLGDELLFPPAGEVNRFPAAPDVTADTRSLLLTAATCLKHARSTQRGDRK